MIRPLRPNPATREPIARTLPRAARRTAIAAPVAAALLSASLAGCGVFGERRDEPANASAEKLYAEAKGELASGGWDRAAKTLERVEGRAAGTPLAQQAAVELAYAQWKSGERVQAGATLDRFIRLNPSSPLLDYAMYLKGLVNFNDGFGFLGGISRQELSERDQQASRDSAQAFRQLVEQFPDSKYAEDARARIDYIANALAEHELHVARYYFRRGAYLAAANRAQTVVKDHPRTPANEEALYILAESYDRLGLETLRDDARRVLAANFPNSRLQASGVRRREQAWWQFW